ncbi:MAG: beta-N-acetylhexosaminidase, partial [Pseudomonadota bacterium]
MPQAAIYGCAGLSVTENERAFFRNADPWGFIVFARNIADPEQLRALTSELCACVGRTAPVLIDQEGGRVARLRPPHWRSAPAMSLFGKAYQDDRERGLDLARRNARLLAAELRAVGVTIDCAPVLDTPQPGAHDIIGDRALATDPDGVAALGRAVMEGLLAGGVAPIVKHVPGHGRALADSHLELPRVDAAKDDLIEIDFAPFKALADAPMAMTAHVVYAAFDGAGPATTSETMVRDVIRGLIGFDGLLMTDDLSMKALGGPMAERVRASLAAGCDLILHCNGDMTEMREIADAAPALS